MNLFISNFTPVFSVVLLLLIISFVLSAGLMIYALRIHSNKAATTFGILMLVISLWVLLKIIALFIVSPEIREFLHKMNLLIVILITPLLVIVSILHTHIPKWVRIKHFRFLFLVPSVLYIIIFISSYKNFLFSDFKIIQSNGIPIHTFEKHFIYNLLDLYNYSLIISALVILISSLSRKQNYFRKQMMLFIIGLIIPILYDSLYIIGYSPIKNYNLSPVFVSVGNCFLAWSMFGYRFFKIIPVARNIIVDNMPDIMLIISNGSYIIDINKSGEELFGLKKEKIVGERFTDIFREYPDLIEIETGLTGKKEISIKTKDQLFHYSMSISPINREKQSEASIILLHDITSRINFEKQIQKLSVAIEQSPVTVVITDLAGNIEYVNPAFENSTGYTSQEAKGNNPRVLKGTTPETTFINLWNTVLSGNIWKGEFINRKKSGELYFEEAIIAPVKNNKGEIINFIAIKNDISFQKETEKTIQLQNEELKELNATKDKFFSIIAHDLRSPFNAILGYSNYLIENIDECEKDQIKLYAGYIHLSANQTLRLLENLLEWSRINRGLVQADLKSHDLKLVANETILISSENARAKSIDLINNIPSDLSILCDLDMIRTILRNLVSNAIKFSLPGGVVEISANMIDKFVQIKIKDSGNGISPENIPYLFSIEKNTTTLGTANEKGTGLGLPLCKELIELQGGNIFVESTLGKGSIFTVEFPGT